MPNTSYLSYKNVGVVDIGKIRSCLFLFHSIFYFIFDGVYKINTNTFILFKCMQHDVYIFAKRNGF